MPEHLVCMCKVSRLMQQVFQFFFVFFCFFLFDARPLTNLSCYVKCQINKIKKTLLHVWWHHTDTPLTYSNGTLIPVSFVFFKTQLEPTISMNIGRKTEGHRLWTRPVSIGRQRLNLVFKRFLCTILAGLRIMVSRVNRQNVKCAFIS